MRICMDVCVCVCFSEESLWCVHRDSPTVSIGTYPRTHQYTHTHTHTDTHTHRHTHTHAHTPTISRSHNPTVGVGVSRKNQVRHSLVFSLKLLFSPCASGQTRPSRAGTVDKV